MAREHHLKTWPEEFQAARAGIKTHEIRVNDRDFKVGDRLHLEEWDPSRERYTGEDERFYVSHIVHGPAWGVPAGICVMSIHNVHGLVDPEAQPQAEPAAVCVCGHLADAHSPTDHQCHMCACEELR